MDSLESKARMFPSALTKLRRFWAVRAGPYAITG